VDFDPGEKRSWTHLHDEFIRAACEFVSQRDSPTGSILQCQAAGIFFEARLEDRKTAMPGLQPGDQLALTGILEVTTTRPIPRTGWADGFRVHLVGPAPVTITRKAPWWTPSRILTTLGISIAIIIWVAVWNWLLQRRVSRQAVLISRQTKLVAVRDERQRIARELHDTLEQELTGLSMQLGNVSSEIGPDDAPARRSLTLARRMLQHCRLEARASVSDLRNLSLLAKDLPEALRGTLTVQVDGSGASLDFGKTGTPVPLRATTQNHLLRIARESVANALRHGKASHVRCRLAYSEEGVSLEIEDDGCGFDSSQPPPTGHFGLVGMQERANKIQAGFTVTSNPGAGARIRVYLPYSSPEALQLENNKP
jgi:signal transduction histidine kinase